MPDYMPKRDNSLVDWLTNFSAKVAANATGLGLTSSQATVITTRCQEIIIAIQAVTPAQAALAAVMQTRDTTKATEIPLLRADISRLKSNPAIPPSLLAELQVVSTSTAFDEESFQPELTAEMVSGHVRLKFKKGGSDGVNIYTRLRGQSAWTFLARDTNSPYDDHRPLATPGVAETREYQAYGVLKDEQIGQPSNIISITFGG